MSYKFTLNLFVVWQTWQGEIFGSVYLGDVESSGGSDGGGGVGGGGVGGRNREVGDLPLPQALCLPVSSHEILASLHDPQDDPHEDPQDQVSQSVNQSPVTSLPSFY